MDSSPPPVVVAVPRRLPQPPSPSSWPPDLTLPLLTQPVPLPLLTRSVSRYVIVSAPPPPALTASRLAHAPVVAGVVVGGAAVVMLLTLSLVCVCRRKTRTWQPQTLDERGGGGGEGEEEEEDKQTTNTDLHPQTRSLDSSGGSTTNSSSGLFGNPATACFPRSTFTYGELEEATDGFSESNFLGQGGFGYVHRGVLPGGRLIAVKQLRAGSNQGEREFLAEIGIISHLHYKHLATLLGYCVTDRKRLLVYEFVPNKTLDFHLHAKGQPSMEWPIRFKIALGSARGLAYLHEECCPKIIHRDVKASNILLDFSFEAKVADFGLAKVYLDNDTHVSTRIMGTFGYLAPEYAASGKLTDKSDVFSFGVLLLELVTGLKPVDHKFLEDSMVDWGRPLLSQGLETGNFDALVDPSLCHNYETGDMARMASCAIACLRQSARHRPKMSRIVKVLEGDVPMEDLNLGARHHQSSLITGDRPRSLGKVI